MGELRPLEASLVLCPPFPKTGQLTWNLNLVLLKANSFLLSNPKPPRSGWAYLHQDRACAPGLLHAQPLGGLLTLLRGPLDVCLPGV